jgi:hypothetical protein
LWESGASSTASPGRIGCLFEVDAALLEGGGKSLHILKVQGKETKETILSGCVDSNVR